MSALLWIVALLIGIFLLHRLALWAESRGWIYYKHSSSSSTRAGSAMLEVQQLLEPSKRHVIEIKREQKEVEDEAGDPPGPSDPR
jgi:hypothetical protein